MRTFVSRFLTGSVYSIVIPANHRPVGEASPPSCDISVPRLDGIENEGMNSTLTFGLVF